MASKPELVSAENAGTSGIIAVIDFAGTHVLFGSNSDGTTLISASSDWVNWSPPVKLSTSEMPLRGDPRDRLTRVASSGSGLAYVGYSGKQTKCDAGGQDCDTAEVGVWTSRDGLDWSGTQLTGSANSSIYAIAGGPKGFVVTGETSGSAAIWWSQTGETWLKIDLPMSVFPAGSSVRGVAYDAARKTYLMAGCYGDAGVATFGGCERPAAWYSADGKSWSKASVEVPTGGADAMWSIYPTAGGDLAIGDLVSDGDCLDCEGVGAAWTSVDGRSWSYKAIDTRDRSARATFKPAIPVSRYRFVGSDGTRVIAGYSSPDGKDVLSSSLDGSTWQPLTVSGSDGGKMALGWLANGGTISICTVSEDGLTVLVDVDDTWSVVLATPVA